MNKFFRYLSFAVIASFLVVFNSCGDDDKPTDPKQPEQPEQKITMEQARNALLEFANISNQFSTVFNESGKQVGSNLTPTKKLNGTKTTYPDVSCEILQNGKYLVTCDYGPSPIICSDNYKRRGIVKIETDGFATTTDNLMTVTFDNYYQQGDWYAHEYKIGDATTIMTIKTSGANLQNPDRIDYEVKVTNGLVTDAVTNKSVSYSETTLRTFDHGDGMGLENMCTWNYYITGTWIGVSSDNVPYQLNANSIPLRYRVCCHFFQDGLLDVNVGNGTLVFQIDYSFTNDPTNDCDCDAHVIIPGIPTPQYLSMCNQQ